MSDTVIRIVGLSKKYILSHQRTRGYKTFRDAISDGARRFGKILTQPFKSQKELPLTKEEFWALQDISLEIKQGERLGIIGRNGAGKSTLLKILSRIVDPSKGKINIKGRVASLLEVGTGFHPELTGRENIYLNGAILGMRRQEIKNKFDEIVAFSEVEKFLDTPVKRYSSGMYVRLAFAVAAHLEPEILVIDEILAVGDAAFQKKCLGKMEDVSKNEGRTVIFVSHNMAAISALTETALWLESGKLKMQDTSRKVIECYINQGMNNSLEWKAKKINLNPIQILGLKLYSHDGQIDVDKDIVFEMEYDIRENIRGAVISLIILSPDGNQILSTEDIDVNPTLMDRRIAGKYISQISIPGGLLAAGRYIVKIHSGVVYQCIYDFEEVVFFDITETGNPIIRRHKKAYIQPYLTWYTKNSHV